MKVLGLLLIFLSSSAAIPLSAQIQTPAASPGQAQRPPSSLGAPDTESAQHPASEQQEVPKATLSGHVYARATGAPLKRARLMLRPAARPTDTTTATTDEQGTYEFRNVEPGSYTLQCTRNGYVRTSYGQKSPRQPSVRLTVHPGQELKDLDFQLIRGGVISGRVLDEDGEPLSSVRVQALARQYRRGQVRLVRRGGDSSDDRGEYRIFDLPPGRYFVRAVWRSFRNQESSFAPVFYPNVLRAEDAQRIPVGEGGEAPRVDIRMQKVPTYSVSGKVLDLVTGRPVTSGGVSARSEESSMFFFGGDRIRSDGSFRLAGLVPGRYQLIAFVERPGASGFGMRSPVLKRFDLHEANIENMVVTVGPGVAVRGKIVAEGGAVSTDGLRVMLMPKAGNSPFPGGMSLANDDLTFEIANVQPGQYDLNVSSPQSPMAIGSSSGMLQSASFYVGEVSADGKNVVEEGLTVSENSPIPDLEVVLDFTGGTVTGLLLDEDEQPISGVHVALLSTDQEKRGSDRYFRSGAADHHGQYKLSAIIPGEYLLLVWPESDVARVQDPELFAQLEEHAVRVTVDKSATVQQDLTLTFDIQTIVRDFLQ